MNMKLAELRDDGWIVVRPPWRSMSFALERDEAVKLLSDLAEATQLDTQDTSAHHMDKILNMLNGLQILARRCQDRDFSAAQDQIWCGENTPAITDSERAILEENGWFVDEEFDCWSHFC